MGKEGAFSRMIETLQHKFDQCKAGLSRLGEERDEAVQQVNELQQSLATMSNSFNREASTNARNTKHAQEMDSVLVELQQNHNAAKDKIASIEQQLEDADGTITQDQKKIEEQKK